VFSLLVEKETKTLTDTQEREETNIGPFSEPDPTFTSKEADFTQIIDNTENFERFSKMGKKTPPIKFTGKIIEIEVKKVQEGRYTGKKYYSLLVEHNDNRYINLKSVLVFENLLRDKSIWQTLINQKEHLGKFYVFYC